MQGNRVLVLGFQDYIFTPQDTGQPRQVRKVTYTDGIVREDNGRHGVEPVTVNATPAALDCLRGQPLPAVCEAVFSVVQRGKSATLEAQAFSPIQPVPLVNAISNAKAA